MTVPSGLASFQDYKKSAVTVWDMEFSPIGLTWMCSKAVMRVPPSK